MKATFYGMGVPNLPQLFSSDAGTKSKGTIIAADLIPIVAAVVQDRTADSPVVASRLIGMTKGLFRSAVHSNGLTLGRIRRCIRLSVDSDAVQFPGVSQFGEPPGPESNYDQRSDASENHSRNGAEPLSGHS